MGSKTTTTQQSYVSPTLPQIPSNLSPEEYEAYLQYEQKVNQSFAESQEEINRSKRSWGIEPTEGTYNYIYVGGKLVPVSITRYRKTPSGPETYQEEIQTMVGGRWVGFGDEELAQLRRQAWIPFYNEVLPEYRRVAAERAKSENFFASIGYPQYGGRYSPFETPEGNVIENITETPEGLLVSYLDLAKWQSEKKAYLASIEARNKLIEEWGAEYQAYHEQKVLSDKKYRDEFAAYKKQVDEYFGDVFSQPQLTIDIAPIEVYETVAITGLAPIKAVREKTSFGVGGTWGFGAGRTLGETKPIIVSGGEKDLGSTINDVLDVISPFALVSHIVSREHGSLTEYIYNLSSSPAVTSNPAVNPQKQIFGTSPDSVRVAAGVVGSFETYINPRVPEISGAIAGDIISGVTGGQVGQTEIVYKDWGISYISGNIIGDVAQAYLGGKAISWARETTIGGRILNPILTPLDKASEYISKHITQPIKGKIVGTYDYVATKLGHQPTMVTGWERTGLGIEGYEFNEITAPKHNIPSPFESYKEIPSVIVDERASQFITQTARATSSPVGVTATEQTIYGKGGKPWSVIVKHPANPVGGGLTQLVEPSTITKIPTPMISSLKTKIASQLFASKFVPQSMWSSGVIAISGIGATKIITGTQRTILSTEEIMSQAVLVPEFFDQTEKNVLKQVQETSTKNIMSPALIVAQARIPIFTQPQTQALIVRPALLQREWDIQIPKIGSMSRLIPIQMSSVIVEQKMKPVQITGLVPIQTQKQVPSQIQTQKPSPYRPSPLTPQPFSFPKAPIIQLPNAFKISGTFGGYKGGWISRTHKIKTWEAMTKEMWGTTKGKQTKGAGFSFSKTAPFGDITKVSKNVFGSFKQPKRSGRKRLSVF